MPTAEETRITDAAELQRILTRYVDSVDGYTQAADTIETHDLSAAFLEIAARRRIVVEHVSTLIEKQGEKPETDGSPEAAVHRWWIRARSGMTDEEFKVILAECVRGEKELARTIEKALEQGNLEANHSQIVSEVAAELKETLHTFESVLDP